jgi:hypothetical protein
LAACQARIAIAGDSALYPTVGKIGIVEGFVKGTKKGCQGKIEMSGF